ncbi:MAG: hypothetical protein RLY17_1070, partial [Pseudomonadota bacterium]
MAERWHGCNWEGYRYLVDEGIPCVAGLLLSFEKKDFMRVFDADIRMINHWLRGPDLNRRPSGYEPDELPDCSTPR